MVYYAYLRKFIDTAHISTNTQNDFLEIKKFFLLKLSRGSTSKKKISES